MNKAHQTTQSWNDLLKETITTRPLPDQALAAIAASASGSPRNRSFGDISAIGYSGDGKPKDIKLNLKTMVELKNDRKFCSWYRAFKGRLKSDRLGYFWNDKFVAPTENDELYAEYEYHCAKVMTALEYLCKTPQSQLIVRKHMDKNAAQECLKELEEVFNAGMISKLDLRAADKEWRDYYLSTSYNKSLVQWLTSWSAKEANYN